MNATQTEIHASNEALVAVQTIRRTLIVRDVVRERQETQARGIRCALHLIKFNRVTEAVRVLESIG